MNHPKHALLAILLLVVLAAIPAPARAEWTSACVPGTAAPLCHFWKGKLKWVDDGDTIDVKLANRKRYRSTVRVRIAGIQAMEQYVYTSHPRERRGECQATARLEQLIKQGHGIVHLAAQDHTSLSGTRRLRRSVSVKLHGAWRDVGEILVAEGHALWLPSTVEWAWNTTFSTLSQQAATRGVNLWDSDVCGVGPSEGAALRVKVHPNAKGNDFDNVNGERVKIENLDPVNPAPLGGWWLRDSTLRRFYFPSWAQVPPGGSITVRVGVGTDTDYSFYWGLRTPLFENPNPLGKVFALHAVNFSFEPADGSMDFEKESSDTHDWPPVTRHRGG